MSKKEVLELRKLTCGCRAESKSESLEREVKWMLTIQIEEDCIRPLQAHIQEYLALGEL